MITQIIWKRVILLWMMLISTMLVVTFASKIHSILLITTAMKENCQRDHPGRIPNESLRHITAYTLDQNYSWKPVMASQGRSSGSTVGIAGIGYYLPEK